MMLQSQKISHDEKSAVVAKSALRVATQLKIPKRTLAQIIGLSEASLSRAGHGTFALNPASKSFELALLFIRMFRSLDAIAGGDAATAGSWLNAENLALGARPIDLIVNISGLYDVIAYLDARRAVV